MHDAQTQSYTSWGELQEVWRQVQAEWHDSTTEHFAAYFWEQLDRDITTYLNALDTLSEALTEARQVAWER